MSCGAAKYLFVSWAVAVVDPALKTTERQEEDVSQRAPSPVMPRVIEGDIMRPLAPLSPTQSSPPKSIRDVAEEVVPQMSLHTEGGGPTPVSLEEQGGESSQPAEKEPGESSPKSTSGPRDPVSVVQCPLLKVAVIFSDKLIFMYVCAEIDQKGSQKDRLYSGGPKLFY